MIRMNQITLKPGHSMEELRQKVARLLHITESEIKEFSIVKQSIDARKKPSILYSYVIDVLSDNEEKILKKCKDPQIKAYEPVLYRLPQNGTIKLADRPVIIGAGPAGLFCAYHMAKAGLRPVLLERGKAVDERTLDVEFFWKTGELDPESNVQFGEGGAGTFSDGKLNTLIKDKDGRNKEVLRLFVKFGAPNKILYENKPHIGTDILRTVVKNMREEILSLGGEVHFESKVTKLLIEKGCITGAEYNHANTIATSVVVLAIGHSARDTFYTLYDQNIEMEAKSFAIGLRVEHPQELVNQSQYGKEYPQSLPTAAYKLTATAANGRGVYSFCMCPGGYVVNASSEHKRLVVNGMSYSDRASTNANSAIIVSVSPSDYPSEHPLAGIEFQRDLEEKAFRLAKGKVPVQSYGEFREKVWGAGSNAAIELEGYDSFYEGFTPLVKGAYEYADVSSILPREVKDAFVDGMEAFGRTIKGFAHPQTVVAGIESRTSSPVRIHRNEELEASIHGLYPCGEGAGYAGGITSAAMDGMRVAEQLIRRYAPMIDVSPKM